jgi:hypothetical protein
MFSIYVLFGWLTPPKGNLVHIGICLGVLVHWRLNNGRCFLSEYDYPGENEYTIEIVNVATGIHLEKYSPDAIEIVSHLLIVVPMLMSIARLVGVTPTRSGL